MTAEAAGSARARARLLDWLAETGPRWGIPADACRVHGWLYLTGEAADTELLAREIGITPIACHEALAWLAEHRLAWETDGGWATGADPWELVVQALEVRRRQEIGPAVDTLRIAAVEAAADPALARRIASLRSLVDDIAALDAQTQRLSPATMRRLIGAGGRAARFFDRALGRPGGRS